MSLKKTVKKVMKKTSIGRNILDKRHAKYEALAEAERIEKEARLEAERLEEEARVEAERLSEIQRIHDEALEYIGDADREHVWAFVSGHTSQDFRGNPKYLFVYVNYYRPDIKAYWICNDDETIALVRSLGFHAYNENTAIAQKIINRTGVVVVEQVKFAWSQGFTDVKNLNLWHGVGFKKIERKQFQGDIAMNLAKKYVMRGTYYKDYMLMTASCPEILEEHSYDCGVDKEKFIKCGYVRNLYQKNFKPIKSFDHDLRAKKGLSADAKLVVYAPTFRAHLGGTFIKAIPDFERLYAFCEEHNYLLIFKMHPNMEREEGFVRATETYGDKPHFLFWDNRDDFYEIMDQMDLAIVDYSGIISDMVAVGIPHFIRYIFDYDEYMSTAGVHGNYMEKTTGIIAKSFDELLECMDNYESRDEKADIKRVNDLLWCYSDGKDDFDKIIQATFDFKPVKREYKNLYSFDVFDTVFTRRVLDPVGIFFKVQELMREEGSFPMSLVCKYPSIRHTAEFNVREYYSKSLDLRDDERVEISFDEIFERIASVYGIDERQVELLKKWELDTELENVIPLKEQLDLIANLRADPKNEVILISDMYLPKDFVVRMLEKADPSLTELPLFLSNEYGVLKISQKLFFEVYKSFEPYYNFEKWIHYGDSLKADQSAPRGFRINTRKVQSPSFNSIQTSLVEEFRNYDSYLIAAMQARMCSEYRFLDDEFVISYVTLCFVPYIDWVLRDAERRGYKVLYFVTRDGHHLKRIADAIIETRGLDFETRLIYASRRTWRVPSYIDEIDHGFWEGYGNFNDLVSKDKLFSAMHLSEEKFRELFPVIDPDTIDFTDKNEVKSLVEMFKDSEGYKQYLLAFAARERAVCEAYTKQEMDFSEKYAVVEFYGRGYNQDCFRRLVADICGTKYEETVVPFYYYRSILPTMDGSVRHNFTTNSTRPYFIEAIFANMPYKSIEKYKKVGDRYEPVINPISYNYNLYESMNEILPEFARRYASLSLKNPEDVDHLLCEFMFDYYKTHTDDPYFAEKVGSQVDSVSLYGNKRQFAPPFTMSDLELFQEGTPRAKMTITSSITMSYTRSDSKVQNKYNDMYQIMPGDNVAGSALLSVNEQKQNDKYRKKYNSDRLRAANFKDLYDLAMNEESFVTDEHGMSQTVINPRKVVNKIVLVTKGKTIRGTSLSLLEKKLTGQSVFEVKTICTGLPKEERPSDEEIAEEIANARFIFINTAIPLFAATKFRDETTVIMLRESAFPVYNQGLTVNYKLKWRTESVVENSKCDLDIIQIPGEGMKTNFLLNYCSGRAVDTLLKGNCITDRYFDSELKEKVRGKIIENVPAAAGKKWIFYMPTPRYRAGCDSWLNMIDLDVLKRLIGDDYYVFISFNNLVKEGTYENTVNIPGFCHLVDDAEIIPRDYMSVCDFIIGDYRDTLFESAILEKPVYFTTGDFETMIKDPNMINAAPHFEGFIFGPVVKDAYELSEQLKNIDGYDYENMRRFKKEMFDYCDGHSTDRVYDFIMQSIGSDQEDRK